MIFFIEEQNLECGGIRENLYDLLDNLKAVIQVVQQWLLHNGKVRELEVIKSTKRLDVSGGFCSTLESQGVCSNISKGMLWQ